MQPRRRRSPSEAVREAQALSPEERAAIMTEMLRNMQLLGFAAEPDTRPRRPAAPKKPKKSKVVPKPGPPQ